MNRTATLTLKGQVLELSEMELHQLQEAVNIALHTEHSTAGHSFGVVHLAWKDTQGHQQHFNRQEEIYC